MLDLLGFWGNVTVFTLFMVGLPLLIAGYLLLTHLYDVTIGPHEGYLDERRDDFSKAICSKFGFMKDFIFTEGFFIFSGVTSVVFWMSTGIAWNDYWRHQGVETVVGTVSAMSEAMASTTAYFFILILVYVALRWSAKKVYLVSQKITKVIDKMEKDNA